MLLKTARLGRCLLFRTVGLSWAVAVSVWTRALQETILLLVYLATPVGVSYDCSVITSLMPAVLCSHGPLRGNPFLHSANDWVWRKKPYLFTHSWCYTFWVLAESLKERFPVFCSYLACWPKLFHARYFCFLHSSNLSYVIPWGHNCHISHELRLAVLLLRRALSCWQQVCCISQEGATKCTFTSDPNLHSVPSSRCCEVESDSDITLWLLAPFIGGSCQFDAFIIASQYVRHCLNFILYKLRFGRRKVIILNIYPENWELSNCQIYVLFSLSDILRTKWSLVIWMYVSCVFWQSSSKPLKTKQKNQAAFLQN